MRGYTKAKDVSKETEVDQKGLLLIQKILYRAAKPYTSMTPYEGDLTEAWRQYYEMSEQIPTFLHIEVGAGWSTFESLPKIITSS